MTRGSQHGARALVLLGAVFLVGAGPRSGSRRTSDFWEEVAEPGRKQYLELIRRGQNLFESAERMRSPQLRRQMLSDALAAFRRAIRRNPQIGDGYCWEGKALYELDQMKEAVRSFTRARSLRSPRADEADICFKLGIAYSKLGAFEQAVQEYNLCDQRVGGPRSDAQNRRATMHANAAEGLMALGRLDEAIQRYQASVALQPGNILGWWGLAVAYDRDEQISKAAEALAPALAADPQMKVLTSESVFFIPAGDIHYYFALGHLIRGDLAASTKEWQAYLAALPQDQWAYRARDHLVELGALSRASAGTKRRAPVPGPGVVDSDSSIQDQVSVRSRLQSSLYRVRQCYQNELKHRPGLSGKLRVAVIVAKDGRVQEAKVASSTLGRPSLHRCVLGVVKGIYFSRPSSGASVSLIYPLEFKPTP